MACDQPRKTRRPLIYPRLHSGACGFRLCNRHSDSKSKFTGAGTASDDVRHTVGSNGRVGRNDNRRNCGEFTKDSTGTVGALFLPKLCLMRCRRIALRALGTPVDAASWTSTRNRIPRVRQADPGVAIRRTKKPKMVQGAPKRHPRHVKGPPRKAHREKATRVFRIWGWAMPMQSAPPSFPEVHRQIYLAIYLAIYLVICNSPSCPNRSPGCLQLHGRSSGGQYGERPRQRRHRRFATY